MTMQIFPMANLSDDLGKANLYAVQFHLLYKGSLSELLQIRTL